MPWRELSTVSQREEFVRLVESGVVSKAELCRRFGISRPTGDKWLKRAWAGLPLEDQSRRPRSSPGKTSAEVERAVIAVRKKNPAWGPRKIAWTLGRRGIEAPACSTIGAILHRHGLIEASESEQRRHPQRFEHAAPNDLWQMDFLGHFALGRGGRCHVLTVLDDHSRYALGVRACANEREVTVRGELTSIFRRYGLPRRILADNGPPWGAPQEWMPYTRLEVWLLDQGVRLSHGRPHHPQTQGKDERFHRTIRAEVVQRRDLDDLVMAGRVLSPWREKYNRDRPHEALGMTPPASRYTPSTRSYDERPEPLEPGPDDVRRRVHNSGYIVWSGRRITVSEGMSGRHVGVRESLERAALLEIRYGPYLMGTIDLADPQPRLSRRRPPLAPLAPAANATAGAEM